MFSKKKPLLLCLGLCLLLGTTAVAQPLYRVVVNGKQLQTEVPPQLVDGRLLVPLRAISEGLGAEVSYDSVSNTAYINLPTTAGPTAQFDGVIDQLYTLERLQMDVHTLNILTHSYGNVYHDLYGVQVGSINMEQLEGAWKWLEDYYPQFRPWILKIQSEVALLPELEQAVVHKGYSTPAQIIQDVDEAYSLLQQAKTAADAKNWDQVHAKAVFAVAKINSLGKAWIDYDNEASSARVALLMQVDRRHPGK